MKKLGSKFAGVMPVFTWTVVVSAQSTAAFKDLDDAPESHPNPAAPQSTVTPKPQRVEGGLPVNRPPCQPGQVSNCQPSRTNATPYRVKLRAALPLTQFRLVNPGNANGSSVGASLLGASIEAELHELWAIEMGGAAVGESAPASPSAPTYLCELDWCRWFTTEEIRMNAVGSFNLTPLPDTGGLGAKG